nr:exonuclease SbcCD subunit D C-terminal domain-containing protein [Massilimicrobiota timonensis]
MGITTFSLHPSQTLQKYQGTFAELMDVNFIEKKDDYLSFELLDQKIIPHAIEQLRILYPHLLQLTYQYLMQDAKQSTFRPMQSIEQMDTLSLFQQFYHDVKNQELSNLAKDVVQELLEKAGEKSEDY